MCIGGLVEVVASLRSGGRSPVELSRITKDIIWGGHRQFGALFRDNYVHVSYCNQSIAVMML